MSDVIYTTNLTKAYGKTLVVNNINLSIAKGEIYGFLGLNGAGKTTTIRMLLGMTTPTSGECYLNGKRVNPNNLDIWCDVGYIVETPYSYPELTVKENLEIVRKLRGIADRNCVSWIIKKLNLEAYTTKKTKHLSMGNIQRLGIAKAMIHKPKILILDEPTNGLDPAGIVEVRDLLTHLAKNEGVTILVSSHKLDEISKLATNIVIIHKGNLIKKINGEQLESQLQKSLLVDGKDRAAIQEILSQAGYKVMNQKTPAVLQINQKNAVQNPGKIATLLVQANHPPTLLKVEKEDLEMYFLRTIQGTGGDQSE
ncbi:MULTISPECIES: ABC transporter ATP-binding protein [Clostridia]|uniref:ABC transporter ATP-binding protein n=1 Tax=Clostridia TaxID=186801 RepID=UPI000EA1FAD2|nr:MULTISPECIES: ABC transporter ATP-binding protein [Clostridia]NBJ68121.1 ABC transporter ATP-binding protein [Roseburia sp. 1XD42-34]RKI81896.1 ABC transporter ATP-binding protein [Clostridium sp. 1xD42-85]